MSFKYLFSLLSVIFEGKSSDIMYFSYGQEILNNIQQYVVCQWSLM